MNDKPGLSENSEELAKKLGTWAAAALVAWLVLAVIVVGSAALYRWVT